VLAAVFGDGQPAAHTERRTVLRCSYETGRHRGRASAPEGGVKEDAAGAALADLPLPTVLAELETSPRGLSGQQARARLQRFGPNEIAEERKSPVLVLLGYFWAPIPWMIEMALALSLVLRRCPMPWPW
jgi:magnesium-transporting ATPase (P-type)